MKIATYEIVNVNITETAIWHDWMEDDDDYIRLSEIVDVDLPMLPKELVVNKQVKAIDERIKKIRANTQVQINEMEAEKQKLLALPGAV